MPLASCARCKKMFHKVSSPVCLECDEAEQVDREKVRDILSRDCSLNIQKTADRAGVDIGVVKRMIDEGEVASAQAVGEVLCGRCGEPAISISKRLCQRCLDKLNQDMIQAKSQIQRTPPKQPDDPGANVRIEFDQKRRV